MSLDKPKIIEGSKLHPLCEPFRERCLHLVDKEGRALDASEPMRTQGKPDLAVVYAAGESVEDVDLWLKSYEEFREYATELLRIREENERKSFKAVAFYLLSDVLPENSVILEIQEPIHAYKLAAAYDDFIESFSSRLGLVFARCQLPREVPDEFYYKPGVMFEGMPLPNQETPARVLLDRVAGMEDLDLVPFGDRSADCVLYTGGDFPVEYAYNIMEGLASDGKIEIIRPYQRVYGLQTGALIRAINKLREKRYGDLEAFLTNCRNLGGSVARDTYSQDIFYFKSRT